jgi:hypothetical protein
MTAPVGPGPEAAARAHAARLLARDPGAREDLAPGALVEPPDLLERLLAGRFHAFELVAHARIGAYHIFKTKLVGVPTLVVQARWAAEQDGRWRIREVEVARVEGPDAGPGPPDGDPDLPADLRAGPRT